MPPNLREKLDGLSGEGSVTTVRVMEQSLNILLTITLELGIRLRGTRNLSRGGRGLRGG